MGQDQSTIIHKDTSLVDVDLRSFNLLRVVGKGAFGKVRIVQKKDSGVLYALKYIDKLQCIRMRAIQNIFRERCILEDIQHPLIVNLRYAFQDDTYMFMVLDLMEGGDLRFHLDQWHGFDERVIKGWACEIVCGVEWLHSRRILHRDLKPDNVLLDARGHAKLTDFNIAVNFSDKRMLKSHSGTLAYMAPDILFDKGYMHQIDWWSLGVIFYELFYGKRPFRGPTNADIAKAIKEGVVVFHDANQVTRRPVRISPAFKNLLEGLMVVDRDRRLGCGESGGREVMEHVFFRGVNWGVVAEGGMLPVFVPDISKPNFDAQEDEAVTGDPMGFRPRQRQNRTELNAWLVNQGAGARTSIPPSPAPTPAAGRGSLAAFLGAAPLEPQAATPPVQQVNPKIVEVTQLLSLAQIKDMHAADPKAPNQERIEAELDFIDANYDVFDWEVLAAQKERERERERGRRGEEVGGFGGDRFGSFGRSKSRSGDDVRGGGVVRGRETPGQTFQRLRSKSIGAMNRAVARGREAVEGGGNGTLDRKKSGVNLRQ